MRLPRSGLARKLGAVAVAASSLLLCARPARACDDLGSALSVFFLTVADGAATVGGTVTGIGSGVQLGRDPPTLGWSIASIVVGGLGLLAGGVSAAVLTNVSCDDEPIFWTAAIVPVLLAGANITFASINLARWSAARRRRRLEPREEEPYEYEEEPEWTLAPVPMALPTSEGGLAPGAGLVAVF